MRFPSCCSIFQYRFESGNSAGPALSYHAFNFFFLKSVEIPFSLPENIPHECSNTSVYSQYTTISYMCIRILYSPCVCVVSTFSRFDSNLVWLLILLEVIWAGKMKFPRPRSRLNIWSLKTQVIRLYCSPRVHPLIPHTRAKSCAYFRPSGFPLRRFPSKPLRTIELVPSLPGKIAYRWRWPPIVSRLQGQ